MHPVVSLVDIVVTVCPSHCNNCVGVYINEILGFRIICKCTRCVHKNNSRKNEGSEGEVMNVERMSGKIE
ncbi:MAG: hypothetical protein DLM72_17840 [Candidatus Nitrosopolaris wilkensis]|nr:MAG: hypothetical protein DLM72_17840 [Candidatus Nitrosopolaris wilkensis]